MYGIKNSSSSIRVIGIDPGLSYTGWSIIDFKDSTIYVVDCGEIKTNTACKLYERLKSIHDNLLSLINLYKPTIAAIEEALVGKGFDSSLKLGHARGVALVVLALTHLEIFEYKPTAIKKAITGSGKADKLQISSMIKILTGGYIAKSSHEADALAIAIYTAWNSSISTYQ